MTRWLLALAITGCSAKAEIGPDVHAYERPDAEAPDAAPMVDAGAPEADARPGATTYTTNDELCSNMYVGQYATVWYAQHNYPGASVSDLYGVMAWVHFVPDAGLDTTMPPFFTHIEQTVWARDGAVAVECPQGWTVTFVRPQ